MVITLSYVAVEILEVIAYSLFFFLSCSIVWMMCVYITDKNQTRSTLRRNYPLIARVRYLCEDLGVFFRQYFFADDREEMPFNRAERSWIYKASKNVDYTVPFGSSLNINIPGSIFFVHSAFPILDHETTKTEEVIIGPYCKFPYSVSSIYNISAMSYGAISAPAIRALSKGAKAAGIWLNTGEGGLSEYHLEGGADLVFQFGTAKYGVRDRNGDFDEKKIREVASYPQVKMIEVKLSQGAKPGKGGMLPGSKVTEEIAKIRGINAGEDSISPNNYPEFKNIGDILDMIKYIRDIANKPVGFKIAVGSFEFFETLCTYINERGIETAPDFITIDSSNGGTGAAPMSLVDSMGLPIKESLPLVVNILKKHGLRDRIKIIASGKLITPSEIAWALCAGADFVNSARGFLFSLGCIQALQCNKNTCPTGITTHNAKLQRGLDPTNKSIRVMNYSNNIEKELVTIAHACGVESPRMLRREHARIVVAPGRSVSMEDIYNYDHRNKNQ